MLRNMVKTKKMIAIEKASGREIKELLSDLNRQMTQIDVCEYLKEKYGISVSQGVLSLWFLKLGIPTRSFQLPDEKSLSKK